MRTTLRAVALLIPLLAARSFAEDDPPAPTGDVVPAQWLLVDSPDLRLRRPIGASALFAAHLLDRDAPPPKAGDTLVGERGAQVTWKASEAKGGRVESGNAAAAFTVVTSDSDRVVLAQLSGATTLWVNGDPFVGDTYGYGFAGVPVALRKGENRIYVVGLRGGFSLVLRPHSEGVSLTSWDVTKPDLLGPTEGPVAVGVVVVNTTRETVSAQVYADPEVPRGTKVRLLPLSVAKVPVLLDAQVDEDGKTGHVAPMLLVTEPRPEGGVRQLPLDVREGGRPRRITRLSSIDGSVQEYALVEPAPSLVPVPTRVVLSLHGAGVDCLAQARSYSRRPGFWIVCPTNRRQFGFDWQDWGRLDAYESLAHFGETTQVPTSKVWLTGHSMGGHGTWHLAANDPDRFVALAPSAGWASHDTYPMGARPRSALADLWHGADRSSDTLSLASNLAPIPTLIVHGTADDNVPAQQAELMRDALVAAGGAPALHLQKDVGHWWDGDLAPGADCVDLPAIFEHFERADPRRKRGAREAPPSRDADWTSADPSIDAAHAGVHVVRPIVYGRPTRVRVDWPESAKPLQSNDPVRITTENVARLTLNFDLRRSLEALKELDPEATELPPELAPRILLDEQPIDLDEGRAWLERGPDGWRAAAPRDGWKTPHRSGPLKRAFDRRFALVLPTRGTPEEERETTARVRSDAQQWWYRGNGFADVVLDTEVVADAERFAGRNLILYGNADTNAAWDKVLGAGPVDVRRGSVRVGDRRFPTASAACFFVRPRADDADGVAGALADTGPRGCRLAMTHALFSSGTGYPDYVVWDERALALADGGVLAAGWFDAAWELDGRGFLAFGGEKAEAR